jgi:hypothetical protein
VLYAGALQVESGFATAACGSDAGGGAGPSSFDGAAASADDESDSVDADSAAELVQGPAVRDVQMLMRTWSLKGPSTLGPSDSGGTGQGGLGEGSARRGNFELESVAGSSAAEVADEPAAQLLRPPLETRPSMPSALGGPPPPPQVPLGKVNVLVFIFLGKQGRGSRGGGRGGGAACVRVPLHILFRCAKCRSAPAHPALAPRPAPFMFGCARACTHLHMQNSPATRCHRRQPCWRATFPKA